MDMFTPLLDWLAQGSAPATFAVLAAKSLILLLLVVAATVLLRGASASRRHLAWAMGMGALVLLPVLHLIAPQVPVGLLDAAGASASVASGAPDALESLPTAILVPTPDGGYDLADGAYLSDVFEANEAGVAFEGMIEPLDAHESAPSASMSLTLPHLNAMAWLALIYLVGIALVGGYYLMGWLRLAGWASAGEPVADERLRTAMHDVLWELDVNRSVALRWTDRAVTPLTWGVFKPVVLLPRASEEWTDERIRMVLLHEVAHIQRLDALTQSLAQVACALFWINPLAWWGASQMRAERERACDDCVLARGERASTYAEHLLDIARSFKAATPSAAVSMAARSELEGRLLDILDGDRPRRAVTRASVGILAVVGALVLLPLAALSPWSDAEAAQPYTAFAVAPAPPMAPEAPPAPPSLHFEVEEHTHGADIERTFDVRAGQTLKLETDVGCIRVESGRSDKLEIHVEHNLGDDLDVRFRQTSGGVEVKADATNQRNRWGRSQNVCFHVIAPSRFDYDVETAGGSIQFEDDVDGRLDVRTAGGSITMRDVSGEVEARTAGGSIRMGDGGASAALNTSGGSITVGRVRGSADVRTSGGSITVSGAGGNLSAITSGGSVSATLYGQPTRRTRLETSGGSVAVTLPSNVNLDLRARTSSGRIRSDFHPDHRKDRDRSDDRLDAKIGRGGPELSMSTSGGNVTIRRAGSSSVQGSSSDSWSGSARGSNSRHDARSASQSSARTDSRTNSRSETRSHTVVDGRVTDSAYSYSYTDDDGVTHTYDSSGELDAATQAVVRESLNAATMGIDEARREIAASRAELRSSHDDMGSAFAESVLSLTEAALTMAMVDTLMIREAMEEARRELEDERHEIRRETQQALIEARQEAAENRLEIESDVADALREARIEIQAELSDAKRELGRALRQIDDDIDDADSDRERQSLRQARTRVQHQLNLIDNQLQQMRKK